MGPTAAEAPAPLSESGEKLLTKYTAQMEALEAEIIESLPEIDAARRAAYEKARDAEIAAGTALAEVSTGQDELCCAEVRPFANSANLFVGGATSPVIE